MLSKESTLDYKKAWYDAMKLIIDTAADAEDGRELVKVLQVANDGVNEAEMLIEMPWY